MSDLQELIKERVRTAVDELNKIEGTDYKYPLVVFNNHRRAMGYYNRKKHTISFSWPIIKTNEDNIEGFMSVVLHEVAHIRYFDHGIGFRRLARALGSRSVRHASDPGVLGLKIPYLFKAHCEECGVLPGGLFRRPRTEKICNKCKTVVSFKEAVL